MLAKTSPLWEEEAVLEYLQLDKSKFYRIKRGQSHAEVERELSLPVKNSFAGAVIPSVTCSEYAVLPFETYASLALKFGVEEEKLKNFNFGRMLYPSRVIYIP